MSLNRSKGRLRFDASHEGPQDDRSEQRIEVDAVRMLARRDHSAGEIRRKLQRLGYTPGAIEAVIARLTDKNLLSDLRFVTGFINRHAQRGHGPGRIRAELRQQGVAPEVIEAQLRSAAVDWNAIAAQVRSRKYRALPRTLSERAKQSRFLQYRGFSTEQIRAAMSKLSAVDTPAADATDNDLDFDSST